MRKHYQLILKLVVSVALLAYLASSMDWAQVRRILGTLDPAFVSLALLLHFVTVAFSLTRWRVIVRNFDIGTPSGRLLRLLLVGYGFNLVLPTSIGGDAARAYYLAQLEKEWLPTTLMTTFLDRFFGLFGLILVGTAAVSFYPIPIEGQSLLPLFLALLGAFLLGSFVLFDRRTRDFLVGRLKRAGRDRLAEKSVAMSEALGRLRGNATAVFQVVGISVLIQLVVIVTTWLAASALNLEAPLLVFAAFVPVINLTMVFPFTINGLGVREAVYFLLFSQIGVPVEEAVLLSLLMFLIMNVPSILGAILYVASDFAPPQAAQVEGE